MVTPACYPPHDGRRYSHRMASYPSYEERRASAYPIHPDSQRTILSEKDGIDEMTPQRKRIAVACGRCRKRKIRCSGDTGNGPCTNCKNAGYEPCQFLRVASQETMMKNHDTFTYNLEASRQYHSRGSTVVPQLPTVPQYPDGVAVPTDPLAYRQNSASFGYNSKPYCPVAGWAQAIPEEQPVNYPMYGPSYHGLPEPEYNMNYRIGSGPPSKPPSNLYVDTEPNYAYSSGPPTTSLAHRPAAGADSSFTFQNVAAGMAGSVNGSERVLPTPVGRSLPSSGASSYRNDSTSSTYSKGSGSSGSGTSPNTPNSDVPSSYTSYEPSSMSSYPSSTLPTQLSRTDLYSTSGSSDAVFSTSDSLRAPTSAADMQYRYTDTTTRRDSTSSAGALTLSHGPTYVPQGHSHHASYMLPGDVGSGGAAESATAADSHRKTAGTLRT
ncbi:Fc.00g031320.m01.CDS01 [Cosmosporella sp. VM-42]